MKIEKERMTIDQMYEKFPDQWLFVVDPEISENTELLSGVVDLVTDSREEIMKASDIYDGDAAIWYTGDIPEGIVFIF